MSNTLYVAWHADEPEGGRWGPVGRLEHIGGGFRFVYTRGARTLPGFVPFTGMPNLEEIYESDELFPLFANRLLAKSRPEYEAYLTWGGFDPDNPPDPLMILAVTEGQRQTDSVEVFPCPQPDANGCYINKFFVHGVRWMTPESQQRILKLHQQEVLRLRREDTNLYDAKAVAVWTDEGQGSVKIGYVPRYLAREVRHVLDNCVPENIQLVVERINESAPMRQRLLCRMNSCWPPGLRPCDGEEFQPIVSGLPSVVH
jgi:hypothetical protein